MPGVIHTASIISLASGFALPTIFPADGTDGWAFTGSTAAQRSGQGTAGANLLINDCLIDLVNNPFLTNPQQLTVYQPGIGPSGEAVARTNYTAGTGDQGFDCVGYFGSTLILHCRMLFRQTVWSGRAIKGMRMGNLAGNSVATVGPLDSGGSNPVWAIGLDNWAMPGHPTPYLSSIPQTIGTYQCVEVGLDITIPTAYHIRVWINDVLGIDQTVDPTSIPSVAPDPTTFTFQRCQVDGTINNPTADGSEDITRIAFSNQRIGMPAGFSP